MWSNMRGNHTWVEVWDGDWHFVGAAEPDKAGLDRGWFTHEASEAQAEVPRHAIYATSRPGVPTAPSPSTILPHGMPGWTRLAREAESPS
jgi:hypothetical protein